MQPFSLLVSWHEGKQEHAEKLMEDLTKDNLLDILQPNAPPSQPGTLSKGISSVFGRLFHGTRVRGQESAPAPSSQSPAGRKFPDLCDWVGELLYVDEECAVNETWSDYEDELCELLGQDAMKLFRVRSFDSEAELMRVSQISVP